MVFIGLGRDIGVVIKLIVDQDATERAYIQEAYKT